MDKIKAFLAKVSAVLSKIFAGFSAVGSLIGNNLKTFLIVFGSIIGYLEFTKIKEWFLVKSGQNEINADNKKNQALVNDENANNKKADELVSHANNLPKTEQPVDDDWYKK